MLAHLGALGRHVGPLGRHLVPLARHLVANMSENVPKKRDRGANIFQDSPQDASDTSSEPPKSAKNLRKPQVF